MPSAGGTRNPFFGSLAYALLQHEGDNPPIATASPTAVDEKNLERLKLISAGLVTGQTGYCRYRHASTLHADCQRGRRIQRMRGASQEESSSASIWDGLFLSAGELLMRQPGIVGIHCVTSVNALHYAYQPKRRGPTPAN